MNHDQYQEELLRLAFHVGRHMRKRMTAADRELGDLKEKVSPYQLQALMALKHQPMTMGQLADELDVTLPSTTSLVDRFVKRGWVTREQDPDDRRITRLQVTHEGHELIMKLKRHRAAALKTLIDVMPHEDLVALHRILSNLNATLEQDKQKEQ